MILPKTDPGKRVACGSALEPCLFPRGHGDIVDIGDVGLDDDVKADASFD